MPSPEHAATDTRATVGHLPTQTQSDLAVAAQGGDTAARDQLVETSMGLMYKIAYRVSDRMKGTDIEDMVQEGCIGFLHGIKKFDPEGGSTLASYAGRWAEAAMTVAHKCRGRTIRIPSRLQEISAKSHRVRESMGRAVSNEKVADKVGENVKRMLHAESAITKYATSGDEPAFPDDSNSPSVMDLIQTTDTRAADDAAPLAVDASMELDKIIRTAHLSDQEARVIREMREDGSEQYELIQSFGVSRQRVNQIWLKALRKLKRAASVVHGKIVS